MKFIMMALALMALISTASAGYGGGYGGGMGGQSMGGMGMGQGGMGMQGGMGGMGGNRGGMGMQGGMGGMGGQGMGGMGGNRGGMGMQGGMGMGNQGMGGMGGNRGGMGMQGGMGMGGMGGQRGGMGMGQDPITGGVSFHNGHRIVGQGGRSGGLNHNRPLNGPLPQRILAHPMMYCEPEDFEIIDLWQGMANIEACERQVLANPGCGAMFVYGASRCYCMRPQMICNLEDADNEFPGANVWRILAQMLEKPNPVRYGPKKTMAMLKETHSLQSPKIPIEEQFHEEIEQRPIILILSFTGVFLLFGTLFVYFISSTNANTHSSRKSFFSSHRQFNQKSANLLKTNKDLIINNNNNDLKTERLLSKNMNEKKIVFNDVKKIENEKLEPIIIKKNYQINEEKSPSSSIRNEKLEFCEHENLIMDQKFDIKLDDMKISTEVLPTMIQT